MKQFLFIFVCVIIVFTGSKLQETKASKVDCVAIKDSLEIIMNIPVKVKPEHVAGYKAAFDKCQAATLKEEACLAYDLFQSYKDSTEFHLFERWKNKPGHQNHMQTEHIKVYFKEISGMQVTAKTKMLTTTVCPNIN